MSRVSDESDDDGTEMVATPAFVCSATATMPSAVDERRTLAAPPASSFCHTQGRQYQSFRGEQAKDQG